MIGSGTVVRTDRQTAGRGQLGAVWESAPGENLTLTIILHPTWLRAEAQAGLSQAVALAIAATIREVTPELTPYIKWPNDLLVRGKKVAGILIENTISGQAITQALIGIGVNINQSYFSEALSNAASLSSLLGSRVDIERFQAVLFSYIEQYYERLRVEGPEGMRVDYLHNLFGRGVWKLYYKMPMEVPFWGCIMEVDEEGRLCVETAQGLEKFTLKEIKQPLE